MDTKRELSSRKRFWIWAITFVLGCALVGGTYGILSEKALGAEQPAVVTQSDSTDQAQRCCSYLAKRLARKFRRGEIRRDHGFKPANAFRSPRVARRVWVRKITRYLENHPNQWREQRRSIVASRSCYPASECHAKSLYDDVVARSNCVSAGYPAARANTCDRDWNNGRGMTKDMLQKFGAVVLCGGGVVIGVVTSTASAGTTAFVAGWGATACGWAAWMGMD